MMWLKNLRISIKLAIVSSFLMFFIAVVGYTGYSGVRAVKGLMEIIYNQHYKSSVSITDTKGNLQGVRAALVTMMSAMDKAKMDEQNEIIKKRFTSK